MSAAAATVAPEVSLKILLCEDDAATRSAMGRLLRRAGADVTTVGDGAEALQELLERHYDVLLTDLHMPAAQMNGFELLEQTAHLPLPNRPRRVVAISGEYDRPSLVESLSRPGGVDFFPKPLDLNHLLDTLGGGLH